MHLSIQMKHLWQGLAYVQSILYFLAVASIKKYIYVTFIIQTDQDRKNKFVRVKLEYVHKIDFLDSKFGLV